MCPAAVGAGIVILSLGWTELTDLARANARAQLRSFPVRDLTPRGSSRIG